ncbi:MAG TPA: hypothetical protein VE621_05730 [Bryobacteraceae bacterium]|jgi:hypothetical protein|nr:hypothetical protein [Bryobacteraceae bacterium]
MDTRNLAFMFYGLAAALAVIAALVVSLVLREQRLQKQLESLARMIEDKETKG